MYFEDLKVGMSVKSGPAVIDRKKMMDFAHEYNPMPVHTDEAFAKTTRFGQVIAPGHMAVMSVWAKYSEVDFFGYELVAGKTSKLDWYKPVFAEDVLVGVAEITSLSVINRHNGIAELTTKVYDQNDELVMKNVMEIVVKRRPEEG